MVWGSVSRARAHPLLLLLQYIPDDLVGGGAAAPPPPTRSTGIYVKIVMNQPARKEESEAASPRFAPPS